MARYKNQLNRRIRVARRSLRKRAVVRRFRARRGKSKLFRQPRPGGASLIVPIKVGYTYDVVGTGAAVVNFDSDIGLQFAPADWFNRYEPMFDYVRINKAHIEITCPYNIGQHNVGTQSLYRMWSKKALSTSEVVPGSITEWLNMQTAKRSTFSGTNNSVNYYITPAYETTVQPLNTAPEEVYTNRHEKDKLAQLLRRCDVIEIGAEHKCPVGNTEPLDANS